MHDYSYLSINGRGTDVIEIRQGVGTYHIAVYGMTRTNFSIVVTSTCVCISFSSFEVVSFLYDTDHLSVYGILIQVRQKIIPPNKGKISVLKITPKFVILSWPVILSYIIHFFNIQFENYLIYFNL
jgi:DNA integrity scanning protein DisA with diadenylate cyclase activity